MGICKQSANNWIIIETTHLHTYRDGAVEKPGCYKNTATNYLEMQKGGYK